jgi:hypothetical protein
MARFGEFKRGKRPNWVDDLIQDKSTTEWILYDSDTQRLRVCHARTQKEAIQKALERNIIPRSTDDIRPRVGGATKKLMSPEEFEEFIQKIKR